MTVVMFELLSRRRRTYEGDSHGWQFFQERSEEDVSILVQDQIEGTDQYRLFKRLNDPIPTQVPDTDVLCLNKRTFKLNDNECIFEVIVRVLPLEK